MPGISPSVLIIRLDAIGDALALTPLLQALAERAIPVDLVLSSANAAVFSTRAARDAVIAPFAQRSRTPENLAAIASFGAELAGRNYTHVLVATEDPGGYRLAKATGAPQRIGFANAWGKPLKTLWVRGFVNHRVYRSAGLDPRAPHECEVLFRLGKPLLGDAEPSSDASQLRPFVLEREPLRRDERVAVQITNKWERLGIAFDDVVDLVERVRAFGGLRLLAAANETDYAGRIAEATGLEIEIFSELEPWKARIAAAAAIVTPDSGALHVAGMTGAPVVGVFPDTRAFELQVARWAPWAAPHRIVRAAAGWTQRAGDALAQLL